MLDFFIALFGGLYYGGRYLSEKTSERNYDKESAARKEFREYLQTTYCVDYQERVRIRGYINTHRDDVYEEFKEELIYVLGDDFRSEFDKPLPPNCGSYVWPGDPNVWLYRLVLASKGKIDDDLGIWHGESVGAPQHRGWNLRFAEMIQKRLCEAGVEDIQLVLIRDSLGLYIQVEDCLASFCDREYELIEPYKGEYHIS